MATRSKLATLSRSTGLALAIALAAAAGVALSSTDTLVERGFAAALERGGKPAAARTGVAQVVHQVAGSEEFWLSQAGAPHAGGAVNLALWPAPVKLGVAVTMTIGGHQRTLEVVDITELPGGVTRVDTASPAASNLVIVSCREAGKADGALLRFIVETGSGAELVAAVPRSL